MFVMGIPVFVVLGPKKELRDPMKDLSIEMQFRGRLVIKEKYF